MAAFNEAFATLSLSALPGVALGVTAFSVHEAMSVLGEAEVAFIAPGPPRDYATLGGTPGLLTITRPNADAPRHFAGIVTAVRVLGTEQGRTAHVLTLRPRMATLAWRSDNRIFQTIAVPAIVAKLLEEGGVPPADVEWRLAATYPDREFCVQWNETDLAFLGRLCAEEGIWWCHHHGPGGDRLVFHDTAAAAAAIDGPPEVPYAAEPGHAVAHATAIGPFATEERMRPGEAVQRDHSFKTPRFDLENTSLAARDPALSVYRYPGRYKTAGTGKRFTEVWHQSLRADHLEASGASDHPALSAGHTVILTGHPAPANNRPWLLTAVSLAGTQPQSQGAHGGEAGASFHATFTAVPADTPWRPPLPPRPVVTGPHTAVVVAPPGEEIHTDEHGRVKVRFPWDRHGPQDGAGADHASCWIRVAQVWAGTRFGAMFLPRVGHEVVVEFLDGDPDQPIITGRVYNAANRPPYALPDKKTVSTLKSRSHKSEGANELRFDDATGAEEIFLHAQKTLEVRVLEDAREAIGRDRHRTVARDAFETVSGNSHHVVEADRHAMVKGDRHDKTDGAHLAEAGASVSLTAGTTVVIEAGSQITLKVGGSFVSIHPGGVDIVGPSINLNSGGAAGTADLPAPPKNAAKAIAATPSDAPQVAAMKAAAKARRPMQRFCKG